MDGENKSKGNIHRALAKCQEQASSHCICPQALRVGLVSSTLPRGGWVSRRWVPSPRSHSRGSAAPRFQFQLAGSLPSNPRPPPALPTQEPSIPTRTEVTRPPWRLPLPPHPQCQPTRHLRLLLPAGRALEWCNQSSLVVSCLCL